MFDFRQERKAARLVERAEREAQRQSAAPAPSPAAGRAGMEKGRKVRGGACGQGQPGSRHPPANLPRRGEGAARRRARGRTRFRRAAGLVLVEPFLRVRRQGAAAGRRLRARGDPHACARPLCRHAARGRIASGDAGLPGQCALDRTRSRRPASTAAAASTRTSPVKSWSCIRSACAAFTRRTTSPVSRRSLPAGP